ncbi:cytochrome P450 10-like [Elysia marginata]|uniref:Cytochrome P450 10-like n=1 Tax=Elysia marginata TaxID=1093978 RepID=A0AAV4I101_9GAST|nr:cytochrome P450 10-like [Elysia marginata]
MFCPRHQVRKLWRRVVTTISTATPDVNQINTPRPFTDIPGPSGLYQWPLVGTILLYKPFSHFTPETTHLLFQHMFQRFGPIVRLQLGAPTVLIYEPNDLEQLFANEGRYPERPPFGLTRNYNIQNGVKDSLADAVGEDWQRLRSPLNKNLSKVDSAEYYLESHNVIASEFAKTLVTSKGDAENIREWFYRYSTECIGLVCLNTRLGLMNADVPIEPDALTFLEESKNIFVQIHRVISGKSIMHDFYRNKTYRAYERSNSFVRSYMKLKLRHAKEALEKANERVGGATEKNLLSSLMGEKDLDFEDVENIMITLYVAGMESTAKNLQVLFFTLASNPDKQEKLYREIRAEVGENGPVTIDALRRMPYLKACVKENFRLVYPSLTGPVRVLQNDAVIRGFTIPARTQIIPCNSHTCRTVFPKADQFLPERWLRSSDSRKLPHATSPLACLQFGYGPRNCIGRRFAEQLIYLAVIKTIQSAKITVEPESSQMKFTYSIFVQPAEVIKFKFIPREPSQTMKQL